MPELPEVETVKNALERVLLGLTIIKVTTLIDKLRYPLKDISNEKLAGEKIHKLERRGRYIIISLNGKKRLLLHLGMSGNCRIVKNDTPPRKHEHVLFELNNGMSWRFDDTRRFGFILLFKAGNEPKCLNNLGPEPLTSDFNASYLFALSRKRKCPIKNLIMNNKAVTGVGNIYANEALFNAGINPIKPSNRLDKEQCELLVNAIKNILKKAIEAGGTTIVDFKRVDGTEGKFKFALKLYGKAGEYCPRCQENHKIKRVKIGGRSTFLCPCCQK